MPPCHGGVSRVRVPYYPHLSLRSVGEWAPAQRIDPPAVQRRRNPWLPVRIRPGLQKTGMYANGRASGLRRRKVWVRIPLCPRTSDCGANGSRRTRLRIWKACLVRVRVSPVRHMEFVAQLAERLTVTQAVVGSSPTKLPHCPFIQRSSIPDFESGHGSSNLPRTTFF